MKYAPLTGWRYVAVVGGLVGAIGLALYPIAIDPMINTEKYSMYHITVPIILILHFPFPEKIQEVTRSDIQQERVQPGSKLYTILHYISNLIFPIFVYRHESLV